MLFIALKHGIKIDKFDHQKFSIERLYIKFDKKLILKVKNIEIYDIQDTKNPKKGYSAVELDGIVKNFKYINKYFEEIDLEALNIENNKISAQYKDEIFFVDTPFLRVDTKLKKEKNNYLVAIDELEFKDFNITIAGNGKADILGNAYSFDGFFITYELAGKLDFSVEDSMIDYTITNVTADSLEEFSNGLVNLGFVDKSVAKWIFGKVIAENYTVDNFSGKFDIKNLDYLPNYLVGNAHANGVYVHFKDGHPAAVADGTNIEFKNGSLYFDLKNPSYEGRDINGSKVWLEGILDHHTKAFINIKTNSQLDDTILNLLNIFGVDIPLKQKSGSLNSDVLVELDIKKDTTDVYGNFILNNSNIEISGAEFYSKNTIIDLNNSKIDIKNANLKMNNIFEVNGLNGTLDVKAKKGDLKGKFSEVNVPDVYSKKDFLSNIKLDFSGKSTIIDIDALGTKLNISKNKTTISLPNLKDIVPYSKLLSSIGIKSGDVSVETNNFKNFKVIANGVNFDTPFVMGDKNIPYLKDSFVIDVSSKSVSGKSGSGNLNFSVKDNVVDVDFTGLDLVLSFNGDSNDINFPKVNFKAKDSHIIFKDIDKVLNLSSYSGNLYQKDISFNAKVIPQGDLFFKKNKDVVVLNATKFTDKSINKFLGRDSFNGGNFVIKAVGETLEDFRVEILMDNTYLTDFVVYQRMLSFLNSVPSLVSLKSPDFNEKGFTVKDGKMYFSKKGNIVHIQGMNFLGTSADIAGIGDIDLKTGNLFIDLEIMYLKDASGIINNIPILNQILLGRDRTLSTVIEVRGTLKEPKYSTKVVEDLLMTPLNLIKNVLELPVSLFD